MSDTTTAIIWNQFSEGIKFAIAPGDWREFEGVYINGCGDEGYEEKAKKLYKTCYDKDGNELLAFVTKEELFNAIRSGKVQFLVETGFLF